MLAARSPGAAIVRMKRMIGREVLGESLDKIGRAVFARLAFLVVRPRLIVEMARTGDVGILERIGSAAQLPRATLGRRFQI